ncbi:MAG: hypothetical protein DSY46_01075, partial [Hydrogenimonas sp.]
LPIASIIGELTEGRMAEFIRNVKLKLLVIFLFPAIGMLYFSSGYVYEKVLQYQSTSYLEDVVKYVKVSTQLIKELQKERGLGIAFLSDQSVYFQKQLQLQRDKSDKAFREFQTFLTHQEGIYDEKSVKKIIEQYTKIESCRKRIDHKQCSLFDILDFYSQIISFLIDSTDVLKARFINENFFQTIVGFRELLMLAEVSGKERALISYLLETRQLTPKLESTLIRLESEFQELKKRFMKETTVPLLILYRQSIDPELSQKYVQMKEKIIFAHNFSDVESKVWWQLATEYINTIYQVDFLVLQQLLDLKERLRHDAFLALVISLILWALSIIALYFLLRIISKILNTFGTLVQAIEDQKQLYKAFAEFSEILIYNKDEQTILHALSMMLYQTDKFHYLWLGKVENGKIIPIVVENIPMSLVEQEMVDTTTQALRMQDKIHYVIKEKRYHVESASRLTGPLYDEIESLAIFPIIKEDEVKYILVIGFDKKELLDAGMIDLITKMTNEVTYAFEKIAIKRDEERLKEELRIAACAFDAHEAITITDANGKILKVNDAFTRITGYKPQEVIGKNPNILKSGKHGKDFYIAMWESIRKYGYWQGEIYNRRKSGEIYPELLSVSAVKNQDGENTHYVAHFFDISEIKEAQQHAEYRAQHDPLTDLYNRQKLVDELERVYLNAVVEKSYNAFLFFDLDNFKYINDYYNHEVGDKVLIEVAQRLKTVLYEHDILARIAGDEFALIACDLGYEKSMAIQKVSIIIEKIKRLFVEPLEINGNRIEVTFSIGVKMFPDQEESYKDVMVNADIAMYHAKKNGKNQFSFFNEQINLESKQFLRLKNELSEAMRKRELVLHYQPKVCVRSGEVVGFEALVRWQHPRRGLLYPDQFLHVTTGNRLSLDLSEYILEEVCLQINTWESHWKGFDKKVSINISGEQFTNKNFTQNMIRIIEKCHTKPQYLDFEIVEDVLLRDLDRAIEVIKTFKEIGITFSMDDFGTGYSSINYLKRLPVDVLKIDKSFILDLFEGKNSQIVKMMIETARIFGLKTVAEGVENKAILQYLDAYGCDYYQGYYFAKPLPVDEVTRLVEERSRTN